ncbi:MULTISPECIES: acyl-CoA thioesterase [unclassified Pseudomonas]|uniref:acyl-CoA thioesterase n=1 Tax=unclassified Pseudomonas TaxID=196821 RepID=UPI00244AB8BC|nr:MULTISPECIES: acyl-CoA thioesterase [unclassified Pseudomonas]MDG9927477.1 acyl-CoA thioesterase [Pseudomonas sp. GD04042]MDH0482546.1 acyl-CoA thioesterase [Pseudomonas sp. GD04015]MDH0602898.1 acyl-CoA thioesterase [Pseudomonas sp. GD03869]
MSEKRLLHTAHIPVRWGDMDNYGHVNNTVYLEYVQEARVAWFASVGLDIDHDAQGPVVLQTLHTYLKPVVHPATVVVELYAGPVGRSSLVVEHRLSTLEDPQSCYGEGHCKLVWIDHGGNVSVLVPDDVRRVMGVDPS